MRTSLFKKAMAFSLATVMTVGITGVVSARVADGTNVATGEWKSFSVCTEDDKAELHAAGKQTWREGLEAVIKKDEAGNELKDAAGNPVYFTYGTDFATEGWITQENTPKTSSNFDFYVKNTGWDGEYNSITGELAGDNPWGLTATMENIPVEAGRNYTISFKVKSTLKVSKKDESGHITGYTTTKHALFKAYEQGNGDPAFDLLSTNNITSDGYMALDSTKDYVDVSAVISVPSDYKSGTIGVKFALGAFLKTYADEIGLSGYVYVRDFSVTANKQYTVNFVSQKKTVATKYVNEGEKVASYAAKRKGYTLSGYKLNGATYNFSSIVTSDMTLVAQWKKTTAPAAPKISSVKSTSKKKAVVTIKKKVKKATGYAIQYSTKANFKGAKQVTSKKTKITLKKLKSGSVVYVRAKCYVNDSAGNKVLSKKWSAKKLVVVK